MFFQKFHLTEYERLKIIDLKRYGWNFSAIADELGTSIQTVKNIFYQYKRSGSFKKAKRKSHSRVTSSKDEEKLVAAALAYPTKTAATLAKELGLNCSLPTIRRRLLKAKTEGKLPVSKEFKT